MLSASAPYAAQFPAMEEDQQAALRGEMLIRLVDAEILDRRRLPWGWIRSRTSSAKSMNYRTGLLYRGYIRSLRDIHHDP